MLEKKRGQSILEYIIVLTAIIAVVIVAATAVIKPAVDKAMNEAAQTIENAANKLPN